MTERPVADYTLCPQCRHPNAYHCPERGCRAILSFDHGYVLCGEGTGP